MQIGVLLKQARLEAGLSQRQLCGDTITRNMLSQIENGSARPSMEVLKILAARLGKPVSFFLEEDVVSSANQGVMEQARGAFVAGEYEQVRKHLRQYQQEALFDPERQLLEAICCLRLAHQAYSQGKVPYAAKLLAECAEFAAKTPYFTPELEKQRLLLQAKVQPEKAGEILGALPSLDGELMLRGRMALDAGEPQRAVKLLDAAEDQTDPEWCLLRGEAASAVKEYAGAAAWFHLAEAAFPDRTAPYLELCYRELEDYKKAYFYACKQKQQER